MSDREEPRLSVSPEPTGEELAAIVAALLVRRERTSSPKAEPQRASRWRQVAKRELVHITEGSTLGTD